nr:hypothetical protein Iba_chr14aCG18580 [Ipomoea batatas]
MPRQQMLVCFTWVPDEENNTNLTAINNCPLPTQQNSSRSSCAAFREDDKDNDSPCASIMLRILAESFSTAAAAEPPPPGIHVNCDGAAASMFSGLSI